MHREFKQRYQDRVGNEDAPTVDFLRPFSDGRSLWFIFDHILFCIPSYLTTDGKECKCN